MIKNKNVISGIIKNKSSSGGGDVHDSGSFKAYLSPLGAWALSFGCTIGWGAFLIPGSSLLPKSGLLGSIIGIAVGTGIMFVIAHNYHTMIVQHPKAGGAFTATRHMMNFDHGLLCAWFLCLTYLGLIWANCSAVALLARYTLGDFFCGHFLYSVAGYDIYLEEIMLCMAAMLAAGGICLMSGRTAARAQIFFALLLAGGLIISFLLSLKAHPAQQSVKPMFLPGSSPWLQIIKAVAIMPWAFVGFESVSHSSEEFTFSPRLSFRIMAVAILMAAMAYLVMLLASVLILPPQYSDWVSYIKDLDNLNGIASVPTFSAIQQALGKNGVVLLGFTMLGGLFSSLIGNLICLSRLLTIMSEKDILPSWLGERTSNGIPGNAILAIMGISMFIPFLGRTAIGWNVDVSNIGATIAYIYTSLDVCRYSRVMGDRKTRLFGIVGVVFSSLFFFLQLIPSYALAKESFLILTGWVILGFILNYHVFRKDNSGGYGRSTIVWVVLAALSLYASFSFVWQSSQIYSQETGQRIESYYNQKSQGPEDSYVKQQLESYHIRQMRNYIISMILTLIAFRVLLSTYTVMNRREMEKEKKLGEVSAKAFNDKLTGAQSINAYRDRELDINTRIKAGEMNPFALVICDVNDLKKVNDRLGHQAGDDYLRSAVHLLREIFSYSPIYRVGGDEFVVFLENEGYEKREKLLEILDHANSNHLLTGEVRIAAGMSEWQEKDELMASVFSRADICMYKKKSEMKGISGS